MPKSETYTLKITGLSFSQAKEIAEHDGELMWSNEDGKTIAYPSADEHPITISFE